MYFDCAEDSIQTNDNRNLDMPLSKKMATKKTIIKAKIFGEKVEEKSLEKEELKMFVIRKTTDVTSK